MKVVVSNIADSGIPRFEIIAETAQDEANFSAVLNRNGDAVAPDAGFTIVAFQRNGNSFASLTFGRNEDAVSGTSTGALVLTGDGTDSYQDDTLIGKRILTVFVDSQVKVPADYTYNDVTGAFVFTNGPVDVDSIIQITYRTLI